MYDRNVKYMKRCNKSCRINKLAKFGSVLRGHYPRYKIELQWITNSVGWDYFVVYEVNLLNPQQLKRLYLFGLQNI